MRAPIYYALAPFLLGISVNSITNSSHGSLLISATLMVFVAIISRRRNLSIVDDRAIVGLILGCLLNVYISAKPLYQTAHREISDIHKIMPPRELNISVELTRTHTTHRDNSKRTIIYYGTIIKAPEIRNDLIGKTVLGSSQNLGGTSAIVGGDILNILGIIKYNDSPQKEHHIDKVYERTDFIVYQERIVGVEESNRINRIRKYIEKSIIANNYISKDCAGFLYAFIFGNKTLLGKEQVTLFQNTGTMHLFAVSGLHIGIAFFTIILILKRFLIWQQIFLPISLIIILLYVMLVGSPASACRAYLMIVIWKLSIIFCRKSNPMSALGWAALILIAFMPEQLFHLGFQLSFTVVLSILWLIGNHSHKKGFSLVNYFTFSFIVSYAAFCGSFLLVIDNFHFINPVSIILNGILMGFVSIVFILCIIYLFMHIFYASIYLSNVMDFIYTIVEQTVIFFNSFHFTHISLSSEFDIPDIFHLFLPLILVVTRSLLKPLWAKLIFLSCLPTGFLFLTLCLN